MTLLQLVNQMVVLVYYPQIFWILVTLKVQLHEILFPSIRAHAAVYHGMYLHLIYLLLDWKNQGLFTRKSF